ncbi:MAG: transcriptional regulator, TetR family [Hyphomicrobiales bacterium]|nr:transcriptional regulator, TetR family [Hyphomicrobiales bacterium]
MAMGRPRAFNKDVALDRAMNVFWRKGYEGASLSELTKAMGINSPSLYAAFGNKEGLLRAALDRYVQLRAEFMRFVLDAPNARETAARILLGTADKLTDPDNPPGCLLVQAGLACGSGSEAIPPELACRRAADEEALRHRFERAKTEGDLPPTSDPDVMARFLSTVLQGMGVQAAAGATRDDLRKIAELTIETFPVGALHKA